MMHAAVYGRLVSAPRELITKNGTPMASARLAVDVTGKDGEDQQTLWADVLAFGRNAELLAGLEKGAMVSAIGRLTRGTWTDREGETREQWTLLADALMSAKTPRPQAGKRDGDAYRASQRMQQPPAMAPSDFDDSIPF